MELPWYGRGRAARQSATTTRARIKLAARAQATERIVDRKPADNDLCER